MPEQRLRQSRWERPKSSGKVTINPSQVRVLTAVAECGMLTTDQLRRYCAFSSNKLVNDHTRKLFMAGYLDRPKIPLSVLDADAPVFGGAPPTVHVITRTGLKALGVERKIPEFSEDNAIFLRHELLVRDIRVWLQLLAAAYSGHTVERWLDGPDAHLQGVLPDAWATYGLGTKGKLTLVFEADRETERGRQSNTDWPKKVREYRQLLTSGIWPQPNVRIVTITLTDRRRDALALLVKEQMDGDDPLMQRFFFASQEVLETGDLLAKAWRVPGKDVLLGFVPESVL